MYTTIKKRLADYDELERGLGRWTPPEPAAPPPPPPTETKAAAADVDALDALLRDRPGWTTTARIRGMTGWSERYVRAVAAEVEAVAGQRGYRHIASASDEEVEAALRRMRAVARGTLDHADRLEMAWLRDRRAGRE